MLQWCSASTTVLHVDQILFRTKASLPQFGRACRKNTDFVSKLFAASDMAFVDLYFSCHLATQLQEDDTISVHLFGEGEEELKREAARHGDVIPLDSLKKQYPVTIGNVSVPPSINPRQGAHQFPSSSLQNNNCTNSSKFDFSHRVQLHRQPILARTTSFTNIPPDFDQTCTWWLHLFCVCSKNVFQQIFYFQIVERNKVSTSLSAPIKSHFVKFDTFHHSF